MKMSEEKQDGNLSAMEVGRRMYDLMASTTEATERPERFVGLGAVELFVALLMDNFPNFDWAESKKMIQAFMAETIMRRRPNRERMARA